MGRKCFVPMCTSGYISNKEKISLFSAPNDKNLLVKWQSQIPRKDRELTTKDHVCEKHFNEQDIIREWTCGGNTFQYKIPKLKKDALPCIFPKSRHPAKRRIIIKQDNNLKKSKRSEDSSLLITPEPELVLIKQDPEPVLIEQDPQPVLIKQEPEQPEPNTTFENSVEISNFSGDIDNNNLFSKLCDSALNLPDLWSIVQIDNKEKHISFGKYFLTLQGIPAAERQIVIKEDLTNWKIFYAKWIIYNYVLVVETSMIIRRTFIVKLPKENI